MNIFRIISCIMISLIIAGPVAYGATTTDQFIVTQVITGGDAIAPSIPLNLTATAISSDQIDLAWSASTDNVGVAGYNIFRDTVAIATTSGTTYADTGLTADTLYSYTVRAFDAAGNYSAHSATATATTEPEAPTPGGGGVGTGTHLDPTLIFDVEVTPDLTSARITWKTERPTRGTLAWGLTNAYELGSVAEQVFAHDHATVLTDLLPDTKYRFIITAKDAHGIVATRMMNFKTLTPPDTDPPANVRDLRAEREGEDDVRLTWKNPGGDFDHVVVVRSNDHYPTSPEDGLLIYEGDDKKITDRDALKDHDQSYYTVFAYDGEGNRSSGAITMIVREGVVLPPPEPSPYAQPLAFADLRFIQDGVVIPFVGEQVKLDATMPFIVELPNERVPEHLKTIMITLKDANGEIFSFLLRSDETANAYRAVIDSLNQNGAFPLSLQVLDYKERTISTAAGTLFAAGSIAEDATKDLMEILASILKDGGTLRLGLFMMLLLLVIAAFLAAQRRKGRRTRQQYAAL